MKWMVLLSYPFFLCTPLLLAQTSEPHPVFEHILELNFSVYKTPATPLIVNDYESLYYHNMFDVLSLLFQEDEYAYDRLKARENERLNWLNKQNSKTALKGFVAAEIKLQWAFVHLKYENRWPAFWSLRKADQLNTENLSQAPHFNPHYKTQGALQVIFGLTPQNTRWAFRFFGLSGTLKEGMTSLAKVEKNTPFAYERDIVQILIQTHLLQNEKQAETVLKNIAFSNKPLTVYFQILMAFKAHRSLEAREWLTDANSSLPYRSYFLGETYFQEGLYEEAILHYHHFITSNSSGNYIKDAYTKIALAHRFEGNMEEYQSTIIMAKEIENTSTEIDKNASYLIVLAPQTQDELLQLRFALDGGFTHRAEQLIKSLLEADLTPMEAVALRYRQAQLAYLLNDLDAAIEAYQDVLKQGDMESTPYFLPNAALQLGLIHKNNGQMEAATKYLNQVLTFNDHPYKNSLDAKARIALSFL